MPLYEYRCLECDHQFEVIQKFSDPPIEQCPKCGGPVRKLLSSPAIQFKGSGWYITDSARKAAAGGESKSEGSAATDSTASSDKSDKSDKSEKSEKSAKPAAASSPESSTKTTASPKAAADRVK
jgi:putative FmdB family regulatory protein